MTLRILSGEFKGRILKSPPSNPTRPTQGVLRQAVFNICQQQIEGALFLDLFAGSGAMGLEALSRGAKQSVFVEQNKSTAQVIRENIQILQVADRAKLLMMDVFRALKFLAKEQVAFDIIYIDPPYTQSALIQPVLNQIEMNHLSSTGAMIFFEDSSQNEELNYESKDLSKVSIRTFGIARLYQYETGAY